MGNALAAFGRSGFMKNYTGMLGSISAYKQGESRIALNEERRKEMENKRLTEEKKQAEDAEMFDFEASAERLPGGPGGAFAKGFKEYGDAMGYMDYSLNPKGQMSKANKAKVWAELDNNPMWSKKLSIDHYNNLHSQLKEVNTQLIEKPDDKKLLEAKEKINQEIHQVGNWIPGIEKEIKRQHDEKVAAALVAEKEKTAKFKEEQDIEAERVKAKREATQKRLDRESKERIAKIKGGKEVNWLGTGKERDIERSKAALPGLIRQAKEDPNALYARGIKMYDDATVYTDPINEAPVKLKSFNKVMKRSMSKSVFAAGEHYDDAVELTELLNDPEVTANFKKAEDSGYWDRTKGTWSNRIFKWMRGAGITADTKTATAVGRMQMMASIQRLKYLGSAVTATELKSIVAWMPSAGDSYDTMINKINLIRKEGKEVFTRFLDVYKHEANMAPFYKAFGIQRFSEGPATSRFKILKVE